MTAEVVAGFGPARQSPPFSKGQTLLTPCPFSLWTEEGGRRSSGVWMGGSAAHPNPKPGSSPLEGAGLGVGAGGGRTADYRLHVRAWVGF